MEEIRKRKVRSYVLRSGRMTNLQKKALEELGEKYVIPFIGEMIDPAKLLGKKRVVVEIGFGMGLATARIAEENPSTGFIGIEVHLPGVGKLLSEIEKRKLDNLRVIRHDAVEVFRCMIPEESLDGIHVFFPDPWPKKKHHKRRLLQREFAEVLAGKLKAGGYIHVSTDWEEYAEWILEVLSSIPSLVNRYRGYSPPNHLRPVTKFEQKGLEREHVIRDIYFERTVL